MFDKQLMIIDLKVRRVMARRLNYERVYSKTQHVCSAMDTAAED